MRRDETDQEILERAEARAARVVAMLTSELECRAEDDVLAAVFAAETMLTLLLESIKLRPSEKLTARLLIDAVRAQARRDSRAWLEEQGELAKTELTS